MKYCLTAIATCLLLISCKQNGEDKPTCLLGYYTNSIYLNSGSGYITLPNAFTPNGDGRNDNFKPIITGTVNGFNFAITDKNGSIIFQTNDVNTGGWDGRNSSGELMPPGRYGVKVNVNDFYQQQMDLCVVLLKHGPSNCIPRSADGTYYFGDMYDMTNQNFNKPTAESVCPQ